MTAAREERYQNIDGLRAFSALGILMMHVQSNANHRFESPALMEFIGSLGDLVFLFMMVSSFSMCCGYFEKIAHGLITPNTFYSRRFSKVWPFFALVSCLDLAVSPGKAALMETFANLTLCFGLLPHANIEVIGVGWTLGVIFVFYLLFPFFCFLFSNRRRAWFSFGIAVLWNLVCGRYFFDGTHVVADFSPRSNILYSGVYFAAGGLIYLYRNEIRTLFPKIRWLLLALTAGGAACYFLIGKTNLFMIATFGLMLIYAVGRESEKGLLNNPVTAFLSGISMEIYLCHMVAFRVAEKLGLTNLFESDLLSFCAAAAMTLGGAVAMALAARWFIAGVSGRLKRNDTNGE